MRAWGAFTFICLPFLHAKQMNAHLFPKNNLLEICLPGSGSHLGNTFCRRLSALSHDQKYKEFLKSESRQQTLLFIVMFVADFVTIVCELGCSVCKGKSLIGTRVDTGFVNRNVEDTWILAVWKH